MIHQYKLGGYNIVLDICSGSVHAVDEIAYDMISMFEGNSRETVLTEMARKYTEVSGEDLIDCYEQVDGLKAAGKLFVPDTMISMLSSHLS